MAAPVQKMGVVIQAHTAPTQLGLRQEEYWGFSATGLPPGSVRDPVSKE